MGAGGAREGRAAGGRGRSGGQEISNEGLEREMVVEDRGRELGLGVRAEGGRWGGKREIRRMGCEVEKEVLARETK